MRKHKGILSILSALILIMALFIPLGYAVNKDIDYNSNADYAEGRVIVQFERTLPEAAKARYKRDLEITESRGLGTEGLELLKFNKNKSVEEMIEKLKKRPGVRFAEPDFKLHAANTNDPSYNKLWGLDDSLNPYSVDAPSVWSQSTGDNIVVAVIDTGVNTSHEDLTNQTLTPTAFLSGVFYNDYTFVPGEDDHGTHVSGTIAAKMNNAKGIVGVSPNVDILPIKFLTDAGGYTSDAVDAIYYAIGQNADIINASWGGGGYSTSLYDAINAFGNPFIAAAGNSGNNLGATRPNGRYIHPRHYPSSYDLPNIISVAAIDSGGGLAWYSNYDTRDSDSSEVDIAAPGSGIYSSISTSNTNYDYFSGTSMATPHISGVVALLMSADQSNLAFEPTSLEQSLGITYGDKVVEFILTTNYGVDNINLDVATGSRIDIKPIMTRYNNDFGQPDTDPPNITSDSLSATVIDDDSISLAWTPSSETNVTYQAFMVIDPSTEISLGSGNDISSMLITDLEPNTTYTFKVEASDAVGNTSTYDSVTATTEPDTTAPVPSGELSFTDVLHDKVTINWDTADDGTGTDVSLLTYEVFNIDDPASPTYNTISGPKVNITSYTVEGLQPMTTYHFDVRVTDLANNSSEYGIKSITTSSGPDLTPPEIEFDDLSANVLSHESIEITWTQADDLVTAQADLEYTILYGTTSGDLSVYSTLTGAEASPLGTMTEAVNGLSPNTTYYFEVKVSDEAGNVASYTETSATTFEAPISQDIFVESTDPANGSRPVPSTPVYINFNVDDIIISEIVGQISVNGTPYDAEFVDGNTVKIKEFITIRRTSYTINVPEGLIVRDGILSQPYTFSFRTSNK